ncbi:MAG: tetratricopeptide repeat protein [Terracidiphilus sp.]
MYHLQRKTNGNLPALRTPRKRYSLKPMLDRPLTMCRTLAPLAALGILLCLLPGILAHASCTAPPSIKTRLESKPTVDTFADLGKWFGDRKQFQCAAQAFAGAVKLQPDSGFLNYMWGLSLYSAGDIQASLAPLRRAADLNPVDARPHLVLGSAFDRVSRTADAEREWRIALAIDPNSAAALDGLSSDLLSDKDYTGTIALLEQPAHQAQRTTQQSLNLGMAYAKTLQLHEAMKVLRDGLGAAPDPLSLANELAVVFMLLERPEEAENVLSAALDRHPGDFDTQVLYLRVLVSRHSEKAQQLGQKLMSAAPRNWEVLYLNAQMEMRDGDLAQARSHLEQSVALKPDYFQSHTTLANILFSLKDFPGAKAQLEEAIDLGDKEPAVQYELAKVLQSLGDTVQAQEKMQTYQAMRKAEADQALAVGKIELGDRALAAGDAPQAIALYREALADDPSEARVAYKLSRALDKTNDLVNEKAELQRAIELNPNLAEAQNQLGYLSGKAGDLAQAESCYRAAVQASPSYLVAWINLAATLADESRWQDAKQAAAHALEIDPSSAEARRLAQAIAAAQPNPQ